MNTMQRFLAAAAGLLALAAAPAHAALKVLACEPEWGALAQAIGAGQLDVTVATTGQQDPHQVQARPSLVARARQADLLVCTGAELEVGWLPLLQQQSGNARIQPGQPGAFMAAESVALKEVPTQLDRAQGDVHAAGNPHIQTDPRNIARVAQALSQRLQQLDAPNAARYAQAYAEFAPRWQAAITAWTSRAAPLRGLSVVSQHKAYVYLYDWLGLQEVAVLEPKPGVEPSPAWLQQVLGTLKARPAKLVLYSAYQDPRPSQWLSSQAGVPAVKLPFTVGGTPASKDLFAFFDDTVSRLLAGAAGQAQP